MTIDEVGYVVDELGNFVEKKDFDGERFRCLYIPGSWIGSEFEHGHWWCPHRPNLDEYMEEIKMNNSKKWVTFIRWWKEECPKLAFPVRRSWKGFSVSVVEAQKIWDKIHEIRREGAKNERN